MPDWISAFRHIKIKINAIHLSDAEQSTKYCSLSDLKLRLHRLILTMNRPSSQLKSGISRSSSHEPTRHASHWNLSKEAHRWRGGKGMELAI